MACDSNSNECARDQCECDLSTVRKLYEQHDIDSSDLFKMADCEVFEKPLFLKKRECCGVIPEFVLYSTDNNEVCEVNNDGFPVVNKLF